MGRKRQSSFDPSRYDCLACPALELPATTLQVNIGIVSSKLYFTLTTIDNSP